MLIYIVITDSKSSDQKVLEVIKREGTMRSVKMFITKKLKADGYIPEEVYFGPDWSLSGDNAIWLLRRKMSRLFRKGTPEGIDERRYVYLLDAHRHTAYQKEIEALAPVKEIQ